MRADKQLTIPKRTDKILRSLIVPATSVFEKWKIELFDI